MGDIARDPQARIESESFVGGIGHSVLYLFEGMRTGVRP